MSNQIWIHKSFSWAMMIALIACLQLAPNQLVAQDLAIDGALILDATATRLNPNAGQPIYTKALHNLEFDRSGKYLAAGQGSGKVFIWDLEKSELVKEFQAHDDWAFSIQFNQKGNSLLTGGGDNKVKIWDLKGDTKEVSSPVSTFERHTGDIHSVIFSPDENSVYSGGDDMLAIIENLKTKTYTTLEQHPRQITAMCLSEDGKSLVTASRDGKIRVFATADGELLQTIDAHSKDCMSVRFVPGTDRIVSGGYDNTVAVWDVGMGYEVQRFKKREGAVVCVDVSPDGEKVASVDHRTLAINLLDKPSEDPEYLSPDIASDEQLSFVRFHPDGNSLSVTTTLGRVLIIDSRDLKVAKILNVPSEPEKSVESQSDQDTSKQAANKKDESKKDESKKDESKKDESKKDESKKDDQ